MVSSRFTNKIKWMVFMVLACSILLVVCILFLTVPTLSDYEFWKSSDAILIGAACVLILMIGCLPMMKMKKISIGFHEMIFQNYLCSSQHKTVNFKDYDYFIIVHEESDNGIFEAVWLIKNQKLADSFSIYQYSNYDELKSALKLKNNGKLELSPLQQLKCRFGGKV